MAASSRSKRAASVKSSAARAAATAVAARAADERGAGDPPEEALGRAAGVERGRENARDVRVVRGSFRASVRERVDRHRLGDQETVRVDRDAPPPHAREQRGAVGAPLARVRLDELLNRLDLRRELQASGRDASPGFFPST